MDSPSVNSMSSASTSMAMSQSTPQSTARSGTTASRSSSSPSSAGLSPGVDPALCMTAVVYVGIVDRKKEVREGREAERVVAFWPPTTNSDTVANISGLAEALATFASIFTNGARREPAIKYDDDEDDADEADDRSRLPQGGAGEASSSAPSTSGPNNHHALSMTADNQRHVFVCPEDDILCFCIFSSEVRGAPTEALRQLLLTTVHAITVVTGPITKVIARDCDVGTDAEGSRCSEHNLSAALAALVPMIENVSLAMSSGLSSEDGRRLHAAVSMAALTDAGARPLGATRFASDVSRRLTGVMAATGAVGGVVLHRGRTVVSTLRSEETDAMERIAHWVLAPAAGLAGYMGTSGSGDSVAATVGGVSGGARYGRKKSLLSRIDSRALYGRRGGGSIGGGDDTGRRSGSTSTSEQANSPWHQCSPLSCASWKRRSSWVDTLTLSYDLEQDRAGHLPVLHIRAASMRACGGAGAMRYGAKRRTRRASLLPCVGKETMLLLFLPLSDSDREYVGMSEISDSAVRIAVREMHNFEALIVSAEANLSRDELRGHVTGYRYMFRNLATGVACASPPQKVSKMSNDSVAVVRGVREELTRYGGSPVVMDDPSGCVIDGDAEVFIRTTNDAWVILRRFGPRELLVVLEKAGETLLEAAAATRHFAGRFFRGMEFRE